MYSFENDRLSNVKNSLPIVILALLTTFLLAACESGSNSAPGSAKKNVVTTVAPVTNIIRNIGGERINLQGIIPEGTDSHTFEPAPSDARTLADADLILVNGLHLETPTEKLAGQNKRQGTSIFRLGDNTLAYKDWIFDFSFPKEKGDPNPHLWMNVLNAKKYAELTRDQLGELDPANKEYYASNYTRYADLLERLDAGIKVAIETIPEKNRKLVTYHDSFAYFAPRYGMTVIGAVQPSDFKEPSPRDVAAIIEQLKREQVPAIFGSEVYPSAVLDQIGKEAGVQFISTLRDDDLPGAKEAPEHTYVGMMLENVRTMVTALGGNAEELKGIEPDNTYGK
jgi:ABC-type Zn uptake system ZnuABC Zn-binding protein ZnuA